MGLEIWAKQKRGFRDGSRFGIRSELGFRFRRSGLGLGLGNESIGSSNWLIWAAGKVIRDIW